MNNVDKEQLDTFLKRLENYLDEEWTMDRLLLEATKAVREGLIYQYNFTKTILGDDIVEIFKTSENKKDGWSYLVADDPSRIKVCIEEFEEMRKAQ